MREKCLACGHYHSFDDSFDGDWDCFDEKGNWIASCGCMWPLLTPEARAKLLKVRKKT